MARGTAERKGRRKAANTSGEQPVGTLFFAVALVVGLVACACAWSWGARISAATSPLAQRLPPRLQQDIDTLVRRAVRLPTGGIPTARGMPGAGGVGFAGKGGLHAVVWRKAPGGGMVAMKAQLLPAQMLCEG